MNSLESAIDFIQNGHKLYVPHISLDFVILGYHAQQLKILLLKFNRSKNWALPGGFMRHQEPLSEAAHRILQERTGLDKLFLQQFHTFGDSPYRTKQRTAREFMENYDLVVEEDNWLLKRTLSVCYFALVDYSRLTVQTDIFSQDYQWWDVKTMPSLAFDQDEVVEKALTTLRLQIYHQPIGYNLLPEKFTIPEIHTLYKTILGKELDERNFAKKLLSLGIIKKLAETRANSRRRPPFLYQFEKEAYEEALQQGIVHTY